MNFLNVDRVVLYLFFTSVMVAINVIISDEAFIKKRSLWVYYGVPGYFLFLCATLPIIEVIIDSSQPFATFDKIDFCCYIYLLTLFWLLVRKYLSPKYLLTKFFLIISNFAFMYLMHSAILASFILCIIILFLLLFDR